jgi:leader peptidase (prepilin peptidase) / N-methyltransferase
MEYMSTGERILIYIIYFLPLALAFVCGSVIGSLSNVVIYRLPKNESLWQPPSHCPGCNTRIAWYDNIPIFSWLRLRAKCRHCGIKISPRYIIVEFISGALYVLVLWVMAYVPMNEGRLPNEPLNLSGLTLSMFPILAKAYILTSLLLILSFIDLELRILPNRLTYSGAIIGLILAFAAFPEGPKDWRIHSYGWLYLDSFLGLLLGGGVLFLIAMIPWIGAQFKRLLVKALIMMAKTDEEKAKIAKEYKLDEDIQVVMGGGDVKLCAMMGAFLGWKAMIVALFVGFLAGAISSVILMMMKTATMKSMIPFGPYLALGGFVAMLCGKTVAWIYYDQGIRHNAPVATQAISCLPHFFAQLLHLFS